MEQNIYQTRAQDSELAKLAARVEELDRDVQSLRNDFDSHLLIEDSRFKELAITLSTIQTKLDVLLVEIKEPMETYKKAKYGFSGLKFLVETIKWLMPLIVGLLIGYGSLKLPDPANAASQITIEKTK